jgi:hypothetical protein
MKDLFVWFNVFLGFRTLKTSRNLSALINLYLDNEEVNGVYLYELGAQFLIVGDLCLWWSNFPYACGKLTIHPSEFYSYSNMPSNSLSLNRVLCLHLGYSQRMPDRITVWRLYKVAKSCSHYFDR